LHSPSSSSYNFVSQTADREFNQRFLRCWKTITSSLVFVNFWGIFGKSML
jgi:hypothetical protein